MFTDLFSSNAHLLTLSHTFPPSAMHINPSVTHFEHQQMQCISTLSHAFWAPATSFDPQPCISTPQPCILSPGNTFLPSSMPQPCILTPIYVFWPPSHIFWAPNDIFRPLTVCFNCSPTRFNHPGLFWHQNTCTSNCMCISSFILILILILCYSTRMCFLCLFYFILVYSTWNACMNNLTCISCIY
jgi:hypothetical protein